MCRRGIVGHFSSISGPRFLRPNLGNGFLHFCTFFGDPTSEWGGLQKYRTGRPRALPSIRRMGRERIGGLSTIRPLIIYDASPGYRPIGEATPRDFYRFRAH